MPDAWISKIFSKFEARYGSLFHDRWKGCDLANVKETWAEELAPFAAKPEAIGYALKVLANAKFPPTLPEFIEACRNAPAPHQPALQHKLTAEDHERAIAMIDKAAKSITGQAEYDPLTWAKKPKSQKAMDMIADAKKNHRRFPALAAIFDQLVADGIANEAGKLLKRYMGNGQWVKA